MNFFKRVNEAVSRKQQTSRGQFCNESNRLKRYTFAVMLEIRKNVEGEEVGNADNFQSERQGREMWITIKLHDVPCMAFSPGSCS